MAAPLQAAQSGPKGPDLSHLIELAKEFDADLCVTEAWGELAPEAPETGADETDAMCISICTARRKPTAAEVKKELREELEASNRETAELRAALVDREGRLAALGSRRSSWMSCEVRSTPALTVALNNLRSQSSCELTA